MQEVEIFILIDSEGTYIANVDQSELDPGDLALGPHRLIRVLLNVPLPTMTTVTATIPAEPDTAVIVAVA